MTSTASGSRISSMELPDAPIELARPSHPGLVHSVILDIPMPSMALAQTLYRAISVDRVLRPKETFVAYSIPGSASEGDGNAAVKIAIYTSTVRMLRLSVNSIMENVTLIVETMQSFAPENVPAQEQGLPASKKAAHDLAIAASDQEKSDATTASNSVPASEFELNGTGRAG